MVLQLIAVLDDICLQLVKIAVEVKEQQVSGNFILQDGAMEIRVFSAKCERSRVMFEAFDLTGDLSALKKIATNSQLDFAYDWMMGWSQRHQLDFESLPMDFELLKTRFKRCCRTVQCLIDGAKIAKIAMIDEYAHAF